MTTIKEVKVQYRKKGDALFKLDVKKTGDAIRKELKRNNFKLLSKLINVSQNDIVELKSIGNFHIWLNEDNPNKLITTIIIKTTTEIKSESFQKI